LTYARNGPGQEQNGISYGCFDLEIVIYLDIPKMGIVINNYPHLSTTKTDIFLFY